MSDCEQHSVIRFLTAKNTSLAEIHQQLSSVYGEEPMSVQHVRKGVCDFLNGCEEVHDLARVGRRSTAQTSDSICFRTGAHGFSPMQK